MVCVKLLSICLGGKTIELAQIANSASINVTGFFLRFSNKISLSNNDCKKTSSMPNCVHIKCRKTRKITTFKIVRRIENASRTNKKTKSKIIVQNPRFRQRFHFFGEK